MKQRFDAAKTLTSMIKRHMEMKDYNKDELRLKNAKLKMVNDLLDQSIKEQKISEKSKKIKKAVLEIKRFWSEDAKKEAQTKAENSIGVKVKALQDKQLLLQQQQKKAEEMFEIEQIMKGKK
jgi:hypothetical protein